MSLPESVAAGMLLGLLSSAHCMGMCGPIAFYIGSNQKGPGRLAPMMWLVAGKTLTYAWIGLMFGWAGHMLTRWAGWIGAARALPAVWGLLLVVTGLHVAGWLPRVRAERFKKLERSLADFIRSFQVPRRPSSLFAAGLVWGFLPCPMVLVPALGAAISGGAGQAEGAMKGFFMMAGFGLGTFPSLALSGSGAGALLAGLRSKLKPQWIGLALAGLGMGLFLFSFHHGAPDSCCAIPG